MAPGTSGPGPILRPHSVGLPLCHGSLSRLVPDHPNSLVACYRWGRVVGNVPATAKRGAIGRCGSPTRSTGERIGERVRRCPEPPRAARGPTCGWVLARCCGWRFADWLDVAFRASSGAGSDADSLWAAVRGGMSAQLFTASFVAIAPVPEVGFVLQAGALGTAVGTLVAARARRRDPGVDAARISAAWSALGIVVGAAVTLLSALVNLLG